MLPTKPELLVLDGQGVVFDAPIKKFLASFTQMNGLSYDTVIKRWHYRIRHLAWTGAIQDEVLWNELAGKKVDARETMRSLYASYRTGPVAHHLAQWSKRVPIWLLSNHRTHWVLPYLESMNLTGVFQRQLISDFTGFVKPDPRSFTPLLDSKETTANILFVDDQIHNIKAARDLGIKTIHASPTQTTWVDEIDRLFRETNNND